VLGLVLGTGAASAAAARVGAAGVLAGSLLVAGQYARIYAVAAGRTATSGTGGSGVMGSL